MGADILSYILYHFIFGKNKAAEGNSGQEMT
jgi:hypothetical protein